jgi:hypothetical protein
MLFIDFVNKGGDQLLELAMELLDLYLLGLLFGISTNLILL